MKLPDDYLELVSTGAAVLRMLAAQLRERAAAQADAPELWLAIRDYEGLAARLTDTDEWAWRRGFADTLISGQDLGVLDELLARGNDAPILASDEQASALARLRRFLRQYRDREFELDEPPAYEL
jgi:hypothetical protein